ncbi:hypothetical protein L2E82_45681 [Cichorium intybus]|uniref:Uncharacterized protein n=1 Tax=Cichorium intybus TaxID=13427 RepID=A0ACB8ZTS1_CICIN|nr:hypothetical protein L2E82_45681 [Cichorium intybus]
MKKAARSEKEEANERGKMGIGTWLQRVVVVDTRCALRASICRTTSRVGPQSDDLVGIFNSVTENQYALVFRRRFDSQKRTHFSPRLGQSTYLGIGGDHFNGTNFVDCMRKLIGDPHTGDPFIVIPF